MNILELFRKDTLDGVLSRVAAALTLIEVLVLAVIHQVSGNVAASSQVPLIVCTIHLPFSMSRWWDLVLLPVFVLLMKVVFDRMEEEEYRDSWTCLTFEDPSHSPVWDMVVVASIFAYLVGIMLGITYAPLVFLFIALGWFPAWIVCALCWMLSDHLRRKKVKPSPTVVQVTETEHPERN